MDSAMLYCNYFLIEKICVYFDGKYKMIIKILPFFPMDASMLSWAVVVTGTQQTNESPGILLIA